jgi:hypothetical protein
MTSATADTHACPWDYCDRPIMIYCAAANPQRPTMLDVLAMVGERLRLAVLQVLLDVVANSVSSRLGA